MYYIERLFDNAHSGETEAVERGKRSVRPGDVKLCRFYLLRMFGLDSTREVDMRSLKYLFGFVPAALTLISLLVGGWTSFLALVVIFGVAPILEHVFRGVEGLGDNLSQEEEDDVRKARTYDWLLWLSVPIQFGLLALFLYRVSFTELTPVEWAGMTLSMGTSCGILGINAAHELGHRRKKSEQNMAKALLLTSLYCHFFIEHNRGHHARVATEADPASSRYGEWLYTFIPRSMVGGWMSAWELERERLSARKARVFSWQNEMLRLQVLQLAFCALILAVFGPAGLAGFILVALMGGILLETVNYLEHYGLEREVMEDGRPERVLPIHSWNSNLPLGRYLLFELSRHSDHHAHARRKYQTLRNFDYAPQLPTGYPGMMVLAWMPPLWFAVMHRHMFNERQRIQEMGKRAAVYGDVEEFAA